MYAAQPASNPLDLMLEEFKAQYRAGERPEQVNSPFGTHGVIYTDEDDQEPYATIGFVLPDDCYAETEDGTYGQLQGFRVYLQAL